MATAIATVTWAVTVCLSHKVFPTHLHLRRLFRSTHAPSSHFQCWHKSLKQICNALAKPSHASWYAANINSIFPLSMRSENNAKIPPRAGKTSEWKWKLGCGKCRCTTQQFNLICWCCSFFCLRNRQRINQVWHTQVGKSIILYSPIKM